MKKTIVGSKKDACEKRARSPSSGNTDNEALYSDVNGALSKAIPKERDCFKAHCCHQLYSIGTSTTWQRPSTAGQSEDYQMPFYLRTTSCYRPRSVDHGQQMLDQTHAWCIENDMAVNIAKCGTFSNDAPSRSMAAKVPVVIDLQVLWVSQWAKMEYKCTTLMENHLDKANKAFLFVSQSLCSRSWPETAKLTIYKTFVRSTMEYGAPLIVLLKNEANTRSSKRAFKKGIERSTSYRPNASDGYWLRGGQKTAGDDSNTQHRVALRRADSTSANTPTGHASIT